MKVCVYEKRGRHSLPRDQQSSKINAKSNVIVMDAKKIK